MEEEVSIVRSQGFSWLSFSICVNRGERKDHWDEIEILNSKPEILNKHQGSKYKFSK